MYEFFIGYLLGSSSLERGSTPLKTTVTRKYSGIINILLDEQNKKEWEIGDKDKGVD